MSYRGGAHSTSDDDSKYRTSESPEEGWDSERAYWEARSPIIRYGRYLQGKGWFTPDMERQLRKQARADAIAALNQAEATAKPDAMHLFTDVYDELPPSLVKQRAELKAHLLRHRAQYPHVTDEQLNSL